MRNKYKKKQLQEKKDEKKMFDKQLDKNSPLTIQKSNTKNSTLLNNKSIDNFRHAININETKKENKSYTFLNKNASSIFRKEISSYNTYNKKFYDKNNKRKNLVEQKETPKEENNNINNNNTNNNSNNENTYSIKKVKKYIINDSKSNNKDATINKNSTNSQNSKNVRESYHLMKNNSQKYNTIIINSGNNKKESNFSLNRNANNYLKHNQFNNLINSIEIKKNNNSYNINNNNNNNNIFNNNNFKNYQKLNIKESVKNSNNFNNFSRNRNFINNNDYFSNRKNKNFNANNNNDYSLNEKSNSLSIISEKISLLNSYEDNSNSLQKEERESLKDKKIFSSKKKNENSEKNSEKKFFNIIEADIQEENENGKSEKSEKLEKIGKYERNNTTRSVMANDIYKNNRYDENKHLFDSQSFLSPKISFDRRYYKSNRINETNIDIENNNNYKRNNDVLQSQNKTSSNNNNLLDRIKKEKHNYLLLKKGKESNNCFNFLKDLKDNNNNNNNIKSRFQENNENIERNKRKHNDTFNFDRDSNSKIGKRWTINKTNDSSLKIGIENDNINNNINSKGKKIYKEIYNNINNGTFKSEDSIKPLMKKNQSLPLKSFKFLVHQANYNDFIKDSFNKYYEANKKTNNHKNTNYNLNESLTLSTETNISGKIRYNNNALSEIFDLSKKDYLKSPMSSISNFYFNNENFSEEEDLNKNYPNISMKRKLIKTSKSDFFTNVMNNSFEIQNNKLNKNKNYTNGIINNNIYSTTLNIYKINDNNNDDLSQLNSILTPSIKTNFLYKNSHRNIDSHRSNDQIIKIDNNRIYRNFSTHNYNESIIPSMLGTDDNELELFYNLENKILLIINKIDDYQICKNECYDFINYYFENQINEHIIELFFNNHNRINIINYIKLEILCYLLCYDISFSNFFNQAVILIKSIINILNNNFLLIVLLFLSIFNKKISEKNKELSKREKLIIKELNKIIKNNLTIRVDNESIKELNIIQLINNNTKNIYNYYKMILDNLYKDYYSINRAYNINNKYKFPNCLKISKYNRVDKKIIILLFFYDSYRLLNNYKIKDLKKFFDLFLDKNKNYNSETEISQIPNREINFLQMTTSLPMSKNTSVKSISNKNKDMSLNKNKIYILPDINKNKYKYSLMMPLNEVLIYSNINNNSYILRPGIFDFLNEMKELFELILISTNFSNYEDEIIENIQKENNFFDYILNRNHGIDNANSFIQDLIALNRNLKHFLIIDTSLNKFKIHKNNILIIRPFFGDFMNDKNTLHYLGQLLHRIRIDSETTEDIRVSANKYRKSFLYSKVAK